MSSSILTVNQLGEPVYFDDDAVALATDMPVKAMDDHLWGTGERNRGDGVIYMGPYLPGKIFHVKGLCNQDLIGWYL